jgi:hypothetical protein
MWLFLIQNNLVGVAGFEPATSCSQSRRDNRATLHPDCGYLVTGCKYTFLYNIQTNILFNFYKNLYLNFIM